jgi:hypothetical protein
LKTLEPENFEEIFKLFDFYHQNNAETEEKLKKISSYIDAFEIQPSNIKFLISKIKINSNDDLKVKFILEKFRPDFKSTIDMITIIRSKCIDGSFLKDKEVPTFLNSDLINGMYCYFMCFQYLNDEFNTLNSSNIVANETNMITFLDNNTGLTLNYPQQNITDYSLLLSLDHIRIINAIIVNFNQKNIRFTQEDILILVKSAQFFPWSINNLSTVFRDLLISIFRMSPNNRFTNNVLIKLYVTLPIDNIIDNNDDKLLIEKKNEFEQDDIELNNLIKALRFLIKYFRRDRDDGIKNIIHVLLEILVEKTNNSVPDLSKHLVSLLDYAVSVSSKSVWNFDSFGIKLDDRCIKQYLNAFTSEEYTSKYNRFSGYSSGASEFESNDNDIDTVISFLLMVLFNCTLLLLIN